MGAAEVRREGRSGREWRGRLNAARPCTWTGRQDERGESPRPGRRAGNRVVDLVADFGGRCGSMHRPVQPVHKHLDVGLQWRIELLVIGGVVADDVHDRAARPRALCRFARPLASPGPSEAGWPPVCRQHGRNRRQRRWPRTGRLVPRGHQAGHYLCPAAHRSRPSPVHHQAPDRQTNCRASNTKPRLPTVTPCTRRCCRWDFIRLPESASAAWLATWTACPCASIAWTGFWHCSSRNSAITRTMPSDWATCILGVLQ